MHKVIILAGGKGTRLRPYTENLPKPLVRLGSKTLIEYVLGNVKRAGLDKVIIAIGHLGHMIEDYLGSEWNGIKIEYYREKELEGTAGCLLKMKNVLEENFIVLMGDHITTIDVMDMYNKHIKSNVIATIALKPYNVIIEYGVAKVEQEFIVGFDEKPTYQYYINTGIYVLNKEIFNYIKIGDDFAKDVFPKLLKDGKKIGHYVSDEYWTDIGRVKDYEFYRDQLSIMEVYSKLFK